MTSKQLADYPIGKPFEAADGCQFCSSKYQVTITEVDDAGMWGTVEYSLAHEDDCPDRWLLDDSNEIDILGWTFSPLRVAFGDWNGQPLASRPNVGPCLNCWRLIIGVPLILFDPNGAYQMDFCFECVENLQLMNLMTPRIKKGS